MSGTEIALGEYLPRYLEELRNPTPAGVRKRAAGARMSAQQNMRMAVEHPGDRAYYEAKADEYIEKAILLEARAADLEAATPTPEITLPMQRRPTRTELLRNGY